LGTHAVEGILCKAKETPFTIRTMHLQNKQLMLDHQIFLENKTKQIIGSYRKQVLQKLDNSGAYDQHGKQSDNRVICQIRSEAFIYSTRIQQECNQPQDTGFKFIMKTQFGITTIISQWKMNPHRFPSKITSLGGYE
jgi:hypothetical protein